MLIGGGIFMLFADKLFGNGWKKEPSYKNAFLIGLFQCLAMIPGVSRSMATIVGGMQQRLTRKSAAEYSFFLAVPTMAGATLLETYKLLKHDSGMLLSGDHLWLLLLGSGVAFVVALLAIRFFIAYVSKYGFKAFGWYRIVAGSVILLLMACGVELNMAG